MPPGSMIELEDLLHQFHGLHPDEVERWIACGWVQPDAAAGRWRFREVDVARVRLIVDLRVVLDVDEETVPLLLSLVDQVYGLRRQLRCLARAVQAEPAEVRARIAEEARRRLG
ncbi:MAG TPA: hypothetical protein VEB64_17955 [Azospirillaceae bacterium]|nr:hypothetical protein [Azospirillaceae bacterium]